MEPVTIIMLMLLSLMLGGAGQTTYKRVQKARRERMRAALLKKLPSAERYVSVFDIFWDLGVSSYALEIMAHQDLLPGRDADLDRVFRTIDDRIEAHGSYQAFIADVLEAIQEFYEDHRAAGDRRLLPTLEMQSTKLLPLPEDHAQPTAAPTLEDDGLPSGYLLDIDLDDRTDARQRKIGGDGALVVTTPVGAQVDLDDLLRVDAASVVRSLVNGRFGDQLTKWFQMRQLRGLRQELDRALSGLFREFERQAKRDPDFTQPLYDLARRWEREAIRITKLEEERPWDDEPWELAADVLVEEARILARYLSRHARKTTDDALSAIRTAASKGDLGMAGYLVYINHYAFFAGRGDAHAQALRDIELASARIQSELRDLEKRRVL